jgi:hypothetical protein
LAQSLPGDDQAVPYKFNNAGQMIGTSRNSATESSRDVYWASQAAQPVDLLGMAENGAEWSTISAQDISDTGYIVGEGLLANGGDFRAFVMIPNSVPEPQAVTFIACGFLSCLLRCRRQVQPSATA